MPKYQGERTYGLDKCPQDYDVLRIRVSVQQHYDIYPTSLVCELYADDYKFLAPWKSLCDVSATDAVLREVRQTAHGVKAGRIPPPKKRVIVELDNALAFLIFTNQVDRMRDWQRAYSLEGRRLRMYAPMDFVFTPLPELRWHKWTGDVLDWRPRFAAKYRKAGLTAIESREKLQRLYTKAYKAKIEALNDRQ